MRIKKITISFTLAILIALSSMLATQGAYAQDTDQGTDQGEKPKTVQGLRNELADVREGIEQAQGEYDAAVKELKELERQIAILEELIRIVGEEIVVAQSQIDENDALLTSLLEQIDALDREITDHDSALNKRLRIMYQTDDSSILAVLLGSESFVDFLTNLEMVQRIHESDKAFLMELEEKLDAVEAKRILAGEIEQMLINQRTELQQQKDQLDADKAALASAQHRVKEIRDNAAAEIARLEEESKRIQQELLRMTSMWGDYSGGAMAWPVLGPITSDYGMRRHPLTGGQVMHNGIDIGCRTGTPVHAATEGIVYFSGWNSGGYGNLVIIDHGVDENGVLIVTMYAHNSANAVSPGTIVARGDIIAYAGSTGNSTGPHVHFEVRANGTPVNPWGWLK